jgi:hypothetical protein
MRAQLLQILADAPKHPNQPPPVVRYNPTTKEAELIAFTASPFQLVDTEHKRILQTKRGLTTEDRSYRYAVIFLIKNQGLAGSTTMRGQAFCAPFAFSHNPHNAHAYVTDARKAKALTASTNFHLHQAFDKSRNYIVYADIDGAQLRDHYAVTTCDHLRPLKKDVVEPLAIYRRRHEAPIILKNLPLDEALAISNESLQRLEQLLNMTHLYPLAIDTAHADFHFVWQSLRIYNYYQRNHTLVNVCYNHCAPIWQQCVKKEKSAEGILIKRAIKHIQAVHAQLTEHLHQQKVLPDADLQKLLDKKIEPSICDCSSSFWRRAQGFATAATLAAGVATAAVLTFGGSSEQ